MANKSLRMKLTIDDAAGRIVIVHEEVNTYPSERGRVIAYGIARLRRMLETEFPGEFSETSGGSF